MQVADWVDVVVTVFAVLAGLLIPLMMRLGAIQREGQKRSDKLENQIGEFRHALENRIGDTDRNVGEVRQELSAVGKIVTFAMGRQAEADARAASASQRPERADAGEPGFGSH